MEGCVYKTRDENVRGGTRGCGWTWVFHRQLSGPLLPQHCDPARCRREATGHERQAHGENDGGGGGGA